MTPDWTLHAKGADFATKPIKVLNNVWWAGNNNRTHEASQKKLQSIYESNQHICCQCNGARMFVRYLSSGRYTVVNHPIEGRHSKQCKYYTEISGQISDREYGGEAEYKEILTFNYHADINSTDSTEPEIHDDPALTVTSQRSQPKLLRLMNQICSEAYLNTYLKPLYPAHTDTKKMELRTLAKLRDAASTIRFGQSTLDHYIFYGESGEQYAQRSLQSKIWKGAGRRHVFLLDIVDTITQNYSELLFDGEPTFYERVIRPGQQGTKGPFLVISSAVEDEGELFRHTACVKPIVSREVPMLVDSNYERKMGLLLIECINLQAERSKKNYWSLHKPLIPKPGASGEQILPDFILSHKLNGKVEFREIVEVMGTDDPGYDERKQRLIPEMKDKFYSKRLVEVKAYIPGRIEIYGDKARTYILSGS